MKKKLQQLFDTFSSNLDEQDLVLQKDYFLLLNQVVDTLLMMNYEKYKSSRVFSSVNDINNYILSVFEQIKINNQEQIEEKINEITRYIGWFIGTNTQKKSSYKKDLSLGKI